jgi:hypothetical protein
MSTSAEENGVGVNIPPLLSWRAEKVNLMYIYDRKLSGSQSRDKEQPITSRPVQHKRIVVYRTVAQLPLTGRRVRVTKMTNTRTGAFSIETADARTGAAVDLAALRAEEERAHAAKYGKLHPLLYDELQRRAPFERIPDGMDRCAKGSGQIDAVMEVPAIGVDTRTEGRVHLVWRGGALAEGPDEVTGTLSAGRHILTRIFCFVTHL